MTAHVGLFPGVNNAIGMVKRYLLVGTTKVFIHGVGKRHCLVWWSSRSESLSIVDRIGAKDMCSVSVSYSMVLTFC
jgi:hypothetical protein